MRGCLFELGFQKLTATVWNILSKINIVYEAVRRESYGSNIPLLANKHLSAALLSGDSR
jgi:hypothetical protein